MPPHNQWTDADALEMDKVDTEESKKKAFNEKLAYDDGFKQGIKVASLILKRIKQKQDDDELWELIQITEIIIQKSVDAGNSEWITEDTDYNNDDEE